MSRRRRRRGRSEDPTYNPNPVYRRDGTIPVTYREEIEHMMFVFGDVPKPNNQCVKIVEEFVRRHICTIMYKVVHLTRRREERRASMNNVFQVYRETPFRVERFQKSLEYNLPYIRNLKEYQKRKALFENQKWKRMIRKNDHILSLGELSSNEYLESVGHRRRREMNKKTIKHHSKLTTINMTSEELSDFERRCKVTFLCRIHDRNTLSGLPTTSSSYSSHHHHRHHGGGGVFPLSGMSPLRPGGIVKSEPGQGGGGQNWMFPPSSSNPQNPVGGSVGGFDANPNASGNEIQSLLPKFCQWVDYGSYGMPFERGAVEVLGSIAYEAVGKVTLTALLAQKDMQLLFQDRFEVSRGISTGVMSTLERKDLSSMHYEDIMKDDGDEEYMCVDNTTPTRMALKPCHIYEAIRRLTSRSKRDTGGINPRNSIDNMGRNIL